MITFVLKQPTVLIGGKRTINKQPTLIVMTAYFDGRRMKLTTGEFIKPADWNPENCRPRKTAPNAAVLTTYLDRMEARVKELHLKLKADFETITPDSLREAINREIRTGGKKETLMQFIERFIEQSRATRKPGSLSVYTSVEKLLKDFHGNKDFNDINPGWFRKYQAYMESGGYSANYIAKNVAIIRELLTLAKKQGLHRNEAYLSDDYQKPTEEVQAIALTYYELLKMYGIELPAGLDRVRIRSMLGAFTCLRFSDSSKITCDDIRDGLIYDRNTKTGTNVVVPMNWVVRQIIEQNPDGIPGGISNQKTNEALKQIGKRAGLTDKVVISKTRGGKVVTETFEKWQLITTHTMRRSGATNMLKMGIPKEQIMKVGGWKTERSFDKYNKVSKEENARLLQNHSFFAEP